MFKQTSTNEVYMSQYQNIILNQDMVPDDFGFEQNLATFRFDHQILGLIPHCIYPERINGSTL